MKKLLTKILSVIVAVTATLGLVMLPKTAVQASEFTFGAVAGASVKYGETIEETGLRFTIEVDKAFYATLGEGVEFGALLTTKKYASNNAVVIDPANGNIADVRYVTDATKFDADQPEDATRFIYYASVTYKFDSAWQEEVKALFGDDADIEAYKLQALATELVCRPYYVIGDEVVYAELSDARSMVKVANGAVIDGDPITEDFVAKYLSTLKEVDAYISEDGETYGLEGVDLEGATFTAGGNASDIDFDTYFADKTVGENYYVTAFKGHKVTRINFLYVTKFIDEASDLSVFVLTGGAEGTAALGHDGYYVLTKDIDATGYVHGTHTYSNNGTTYPSSSDKGFKGTLDGNGYTISNFASINNGLFGQAAAPVVKNISFTNVSIAGYYGSLFAHSINRDGWVDGTGYTKEALFENVYIQIDKVTFGNSKRVGVLANNTMPLSIRVRNVVVEYTNAKADGVYDNVYALTHEFGIYGGSNNADMQKTLTFENVYAITDLPVMYTRGSNPYAAENQVEHTISNGYWIASVGAILDEGYADFLTAKGLTLDVHKVARGLRHYDNYKVMVNDATSNETSLATFSDKYWVVSNGVPYWKSTFANRVDLVVTDSQENVVTEDILIKDTKTKYTLNLFDGTANISNLTINAPSGVLVNGNVISLASEPTSVGSYDIEVSAVVGGYTVVRTLTINYSNAFEVVGKVLYSQMDKALDLDSLNVALADAGQRQITKEQITGYIVNGETVDTLELEVIISGIGRSRVMDTAQSVTVCVGNKAYLLNNVYAYTKIIDDAEDLNVFTLTGATEENIYNELDGYFIVTKNINATSLVLGNHKFMSNASYPGNGYNSDRGFTGVFDGQGYTIDGLTTKNAGLFGNTNAPIIKDIAFTNVNLTGYYPTLFAQTISRSKTPENQFTGHDALLSNIYVSVNSATTGGSGRIGILCNQTLAGVVKLQNVIVDYTNVSDAVQSQIEAGNDFYMLGSSTLTMAATTAMYVNCYAISTAPLLQRKAMPGFGENQVEYTLTGNKVTAVGNVLDEQVNEILARCEKTLAVDHVIVGLKAYADYEKMAKDTANDYSSFSSNFWDTTSGVPTWKHKHGYTLNVVKPNCEEEGYTTYVCSCGDTYTSNKEDALGHNYGKAVYVGNDKHEQVCLNDNGHVLVSDCYGGVATETQRAVCEGCNSEYGNLKDHTHSHVVTVVAPTCTQEGYTLHSCFCGDVYKSDYLEIDPTAHNYGDWLYDSNLGHYKVCFNDETHVVYATNVAEDKVLYSADDKELNLLSLRRALDEVGVKITSLSQIEGYIVNGERVDTLELNVTITGTYGNRVVDTAQSIIVIVDGQEIVLDNVYAYTKLIDEASDLDYFRFDYANTGVIPTHAGYYLVTNNIDASNYVMQDHTFSSNAVYPNSNDKKAGFKGVFDGNGYTISNLTTVSNGIFGSANQPLIKNIAFTNVALTGYYNCTISNIFEGQNTKLKNVYVEVVSSTLARVGALTYSAINPNASLENVVTVWDLDETELARLTTNGIFASIAHLNFNVANYKNFYKNCVAISQAPLGMEISKGAIKISDDGIHYRLCVAPNKVTVDGDVITTNNETLNTILTATNYTLQPINIATGIVSYDTAEEMAKDVANNTDLLASFDSKYWTIINGVPYFKSSYYGYEMHDFTEELVMNAALKSPATCTTNAVYYKSCKCGEVGKIETFEVEGLLPHVYDKEVVSYDALITKGEDGNLSLFYKSCVCGKIGEDATFESKEMFGKNFIVFGDSFSAYIGTIPEGHLPYYKGDNILNSPDQMWWSLLAEERGGNPVRIDASSGSTVSYAGHNPFINRLNKLYEEGFFEENQIDYVFILGGTNDNGHELGEEMYSGWTDENLKQALPGICYFFCRVREILPNAEIYGIANLRNKQAITDAIYNSCEKVGGHYVGINVELESSHPTALGMQQIKDEILKVFDAE